MADVADAQQRRVGLRAQHDVLELLRVDQAARRVHRVLEIGALRRGRLAKRSRGILAVLRLDGVADVAWR